VKIHHVGIVVPSIDEHMKDHLAPWFSRAAIGPTISDPLQKANVAFVELDGGRIELVEPAAQDSPVSAVLKHGFAVYHHICFEVPDLDAALDHCRNLRMVVVSPPKAAAAFDGRRIAFVLGRDRLLWELLETSMK
jgi:methylmalonyl-CoA/ethylmalonyl-CoA epimerase